MLKRWLLRGILIVPILLGLAGWAWSYGNFAELFSVTTTGVYVRAVTSGGSLGVMWATPGYFRPGDPGWHFLHYPVPAPERRILVVRGNSILCGFGWQTRTYSGGVTVRLVLVPYYALLLPLAAALVLVWRKTRPPRPGTAFPIETGAAAENAS